MITITKKRSLSLALGLTLALSHIPAGALAIQEDGLCSHHEAHSDQCGFGTESGCVFIKEGCPDCASLTTIIGTDVLIDGHSFPYTGTEIRPQITVTVDGTVLTQGTHYRLDYENNIQPGEAKVTVTGLEEGGYQGIVTIAFTITPAEIPDGSETPEDPTEGTEPEETEPEETIPEETAPEETRPLEYKITKGNGSTWYQGSGKHLSFTVNGKTADLKEVLVNGKALDKASYTAEGSGLTLNKSYLNKLTVGKYTLTIRFADGEAEGTFHVSNKLDTSNPATGDSLHPGLWILAGTGSLCALGYMTLRMFNKKQS